MIKEMSISDIKSLRHELSSNLTGENCFGNQFLFSEDFLASYVYIKLIKVLQELTGIKSLVTSEIVIDGEEITTNGNSVCEDDVVDAFYEEVSTYLEETLLPLILDMEYYALGNLLGDCWDNDYPDWIEDAMDNHGLLRMPSGYGPAVIDVENSGYTEEEVSKNLAETMESFFCMPKGVSEEMVSVVKGLLDIMGSETYVTQHLYVSKNIATFHTWMKGVKKKSLKAKEREMFSLAEVLMDYLLEPMEYWVKQLTKSGFTEDGYFYTAFCELSCSYTNECVDSRSMKWGSFIAPVLLEEVVTCFNDKYGFLKGEESEQYAKYA